MKVAVLSIDGKKEKQIETSIFDKRIRQDLAQKLYEVEKSIQPYSPFEKAGKQHSASGKVRHSRRKWRTAYGHGISRVPRKIFWRRGTQFYWVGAEIASARGGRRAHPPRVVHFQIRKKINKKEITQAFESAIASTAQGEYIKKRYEKIKNIDAPIVVESKILKLKTKEFFSALKKILNDNFELALRKKKVRAGKGKGRNRRYKTRAGLLLIIGKDENARIQGIEIMKTNELTISKLMPFGRLTAYTEKAVDELENFGKETEK